MSHWNHRVIVVPDGSDFAPDHLYCLHEVYYNDDGKIRAWSEKPIRIMGDSKKELKETLKRMIRALDKPFLIEKKKGKKTILEEYAP